MYKTCGQYHFTRVHSWLGTFLNLCIIFYMPCSKREIANPYTQLMGKNSVVHTLDACGASSKLQSVRFYTRLDQAPLIRAKASHKHFNAWLTLCLSDRPQPPQELDGLDNWRNPQIHEAEIAELLLSLSQFFDSAFRQQQPFPFLISNN